MTTAETQSIILERDMLHSQDKVWRALTEAPLLQEWLMANDFEPVVGHRFTFRAPPQPHWNGVTACEVLEVEPKGRLAYTWNSTDDAADGLRTTVAWTLQPTPKGVRVRLEQSGFRPRDKRSLQGASFGWQRFLEGLERVAGTLS
jgi:uncharacterized protein YndB with AHSA1/START domain